MTTPDIIAAFARISPESGLYILSGCAVAAIGWLRVKRLYRKMRRARWARSCASIEQLGKISPSEFETFAAAVFERRGWTVQIVGREGRPDGGLDLLLTAGKKRVVVQCKRYAAKVSASVVREVVGVMMHHRASGAYVVALSGFTRPAQKFAEGKPIKLIDGHGLLKALRAERPRPRDPLTGFRSF